MMKQREQIKWKIDSHWIHDFKFTLPLVLSHCARDVPVIKFVVVIYDTRNAMQNIQCVRVFAIDVDVNVNVNAREMESENGCDSGLHANVSRILHKNKSFGAERQRADFVDVLVQ